MTLLDADQKIVEVKHTLVKLRDDRVAFYESLQRSSIPFAGEDILAAITALNRAINALISAKHYTEDALWRGRLWEYEQ